MERFVRLEIIKVPRSYSANKTFQTPLEVEKAILSTFKRDSSRTSAGVAAPLLNLRCNKDQLLLANMKDELRPPTAPPLYPPCPQRAMAMLTAFNKLHAYRPI